MGLPVLSTCVGEASRVCPSDSTVLVDVGDETGFTAALQQLIASEFPADTNSSSAPLSITVAPPAALVLT